MDLPEQGGESGAAGQATETGAGAGGQGNDGGTTGEGGGGGATTGACDAEPCLNDATCAEEGAGYLCQCAPGFTGEHCELPRFQWMTPAPDLITVPHGVSGDGKVVVGYTTDHDRGLRTPFRWTAERGFENFAFSEPMDGGIAYAANGDGSVIVGQLWTPSVIGSTAFRWTAAQGIQLLGADSPSEGYCVSENGNVVAGKHANNRLFRWTLASQVQDLGTFTTGGALAQTGDIQHVIGISPGGNSITGMTWIGPGPSDSTLFRWQANRFEYVTLTGSIGPRSGGDASVVVGLSYEQVTQEMRMYRWTSVPLEYISLGELVPTDIAGVGGKESEVVLGNSAQGSWIWTSKHGARLLTELFSELGVEAPPDIRVQAVSADGNVIIATHGRQASIIRIGQP